MEYIDVIDNTKYYFITYQASCRGTSSPVMWHDVIDESPMKFIKDVERIEESGDNRYYNFRIINTLEISRDEYDEYKYEF